MDYNIIVVSGEFRLKDPRKVPFIHACVTYGKNSNSRPSILFDVAVKREILFERRGKINNPANEERPRQEVRDS